MSAEKLVYSNDRWKIAFVIFTEVLCLALTTLFFLNIRVEPSMEFVKYAAPLLAAAFLFIPITRVEIDPQASKIYIRIRRFFDLKLGKFEKTRVLKFSEVKDVMVVTPPEEGARVELALTTGETLCLLNMIKVSEAEQVVGAIKGLASLR